jgi:hypothetical protein
MLIESRRHVAQTRPVARPLPPCLVIALLSLSFALAAICALLLLILAWETIGWVRYRLFVEAIACAFAGVLTLYNLAEGRARR